MIETKNDNRLFKPASEDDIANRPRVIGIDSKKLFYDLNGGQKGEFYKYLEGFKGDPRIAWYPSAGVDFRAMLYLSPEYARINPPSEPEPLPPNIFLFTDYFPWSSSTFLDSRVIHSDDRTKITVNKLEELPRVDLALDNEIVDFPEGSHATNRAVFMEVEVSSDQLGKHSYPVVYVFAENESFCAKKLIPLEAKISHVIHVRYGGGCGGGGKSTGIWILNVLQRLGCEAFITDGHYGMQSGDEAALRLYPELAGTPPILKKIRFLPGSGWSGHGEVTWNILSKQVTKGADSSAISAEGTKKPRPRSPNFPQPGVNPKPKVLLLGI